MHQLCIHGCFLFVSGRGSRSTSGANNGAAGLCRARPLHAWDGLQLQLLSIRLVGPKAEK